MNVLVNGIGNIGTTVLNLLVRYKNELGISKIYANKNTPHSWNEVELDVLRDAGIILCTPDKQKRFEQFEKILPSINYIFETGSNGSGMRNKSLYYSIKSLKGCSAQGSEKEFGIPFMSGINDECIPGKKFVHVVSCNTHGTASLLSTFAGNRLENLETADIVVVRRSEDIGNHERLVSANVVARHLDPYIGTHHAIDVCDMFVTVGVKCNLTSSDITTPSQLMHSVRFNITLKNSISKNEIFSKISDNIYLSQTKKFDSNVIFELGRRYGFNGRIFSHAIVISDNLIISGNTIKGWAFVPQEGNSILSTIHAFLLQMQIENSGSVFTKIKSDLLRSAW